MNTSRYTQSLRVLLNRRVCATHWRHYSEVKSPNLSHFQLPNEPIRTRFAPSPTGYLHLGSLRTALFNYLAAKHTKGQFILRIEDTDETRTIPDAEERICQDLRWAGLEWDEGPDVGGAYGPYKQSQRSHIYREHADQLLKSGHAFRCFCSAGRLRLVAEQQSKLKLRTDYDGSCEGIDPMEADERAQTGERHVIRLRMTRAIDFRDDLVHFQSSRSLKKPPPTRISPTGGLAMESPILLKSDGKPTYHLANVVDDHFMKITHVFRGQEWLLSTPKHIYLFEAFGWRPPRYGHVGLLLGVDQQKLSKRKGDIDVLRFRDELDILPSTLTNYLALMGWSHSSRSDVMSLKEMTDNFSLKFKRGNAIATMEKLWYLQKQHVRAAIKEGGVTRDDLIRKIVKAAKVRFENPESQHPSLRHNESAEKYVELILSYDAPKFTDSTTFVNNLDYYFTNDVASQPSTLSGTANTVSTDRVLDILTKAYHLLRPISNAAWTIENIKKKVEDLVEEIANDDANEADEHQRKLGRATQDVHYSIRLAMTGGKPCGSTDVVMFILGDCVTLRRLEEKSIVL
ncbi:MAG: Glutamate--tRNA ligase mitochondrial [Vezdaea aestivalis]|nr:MAG: Glutamate--tRNA ligase mitochondrial [Vezdaea aestivalis]